MKVWLLTALIAFIVVAGFKYLSYQQHLSESTIEKARLNNVLDRTRATVSSELKIIKPAAKLIARDVSNKLFTDTQSTEAETALSDFFTSHPLNASFILERLRCNEQQCELIGEYYGSESELADVVSALQEESWWQQASPLLTTELSERGVRLTMLFSSQKARVEKRDGTSSSVAG